jgi:tetratricopeptide (TPR) repeat protein
MPETEGGAGERREAIVIASWARWLAGILGLGGLGTGGAAVFLTHVEAGPVALIGAGVLFLFLALGGVLPTRVRVGDAEAEFHRQVRQSVERIEQRTPAVGVLMDAGGVSLAAVAAGKAPVPNPSLVRAGVEVGSLAEEVRQLEAIAGEQTVPPAALLELGRWYLAQQDWARGADYLDAYVRRADADWEAYFILGVAYANLRQGEKTDLASLNAYNEAMRRLPPDLQQDTVARLYSHRSGIKKRVGLLRDAKTDAEIARQLAQKRYERVDAVYNLACIEAMLGNRDAAIARIAELSRLGAVHLVRGHLHDYFSSLLADPEFQALVGVSSTET